MKHGLRMVTEHSKLVVVDGNESSFLQRHRVPPLAQEPGG